jgi:DNA-binding CsgD family transcriptional regulator
MTSKINVNQVKELYYAGFSQIKIAEILNTTAQTICRLMKRNNIPARSLSDASSIKIVLSNLEKSEILDLYKQGKNRESIAKQLNITEWAVRKTLDGYCFGTSLSLKKYHQNNTIPLTASQQQLILGSLIGDASLVFNEENDRYDFQVGHCIEQKEYLEHKAKILNSSIRSYIKDENSFSAGKEFFITSYYNKYELQKIYNICFVNRIKTISHKWLDLLTEEGISYWFMDDGTSSFLRNNKSVSARFSTLSFPKEQIILLQNKLLKFNIETSIHKHSDGEGLVISVLTKSINKLMDLVEPFIIPCMSYKIKRISNV